MEIAQLEKYPIVRLVVPFMIGILCGDACSMSVWGYGATAIGLCAVCLLACYRHKWLFGCALYAFLFCLGAQLLFMQKQQRLVKWPEEKRLYTGVLQDVPQEKARSWLLPLQVDGRAVLLYVPKDSFPQRLRRGSRIYFYAQINYPNQPKIPGHFDYARYLLRKGITGTAYAWKDSWTFREPLTGDVTLKRQALNVRDRLQNRYRELGFQGDELAVLSALTLGDKSELRNELEEIYSITGASHVLALSGLHVGIVYGICTFLLSFLAVGRYTVWIRAGCSLLLLWGFAFIVGLAPSVVRSACMFSLFAVGQCLNRKILSLNTLSLSAFLMLLYQPFYLFDVGFQMSYAAVASIILLHPQVSAWWQPSCKVLRYFWGIITVSLVAQIGVAPLILLYFSRFSLYFLLTNLWVIPITFLLVAGSLLILGCGFCFPLQRCIAEGLNEAIQLMHQGLRGIERMPLSAVESAAMQPVSVVLFYLLVGCLAIYAIRRSGRWLVGVLLCIACLLGVSLAVRLHPQSPQLLFYHSGGGISVEYDDGHGEVVRWAPDESKTTFKQIGGETVVWLTDSRWQRYVSDRPLAADYLLIQRGYRGEVSPLREVFQMRRVILDSSLDEAVRRRLQRECEALKIAVISLSGEGYWFAKR